MKINEIIHSIETNDELEKLKDKDTKQQLQELLSDFLAQEVQPLILLNLISEQLSGNFFHFDRSERPLPFLSRFIPILFYSFTRQPQKILKVFQQAIAQSIEAEMNENELKIFSLGGTELKFTKSLVNPMYHTFISSFDAQKKGLWHRMSMVAWLRPTNTANENYSLSVIVTRPTGRILEKLIEAGGEMVGVEELRKIGKLDNRKLKIAVSEINTFNQKNNSNEISPVRIEAVTTTGSKPKIIGYRLVVVKELEKKPEEAAA